MPQLDQLTEGLLYTKTAHKLKRPPWRAKSAYSQVQNGTRGCPKWHIDSKVKEIKVRFIQWTSWSIEGWL